MQRRGEERDFQEQIDAINKKAMLIVHDVRDELQRPEHARGSRSWSRQLKKTKSEAGTADKLAPDVPRRFVAAADQHNEIPAPVTHRAPRATDAPPPQTDTLGAIDQSLSQGDIDERLATERAIVATTLSSADPNEPGGGATATGRSVTSPITLDDMAETDEAMACCVHEAEIDQFDDSQAASMNAPEVKQLQAENKQLTEMLAKWAGGDFVQASSIAGVNRMESRPSDEKKPVPSPMVRLGPDNISMPEFNQARAGLQMLIGKKTISVSINGDRVMDATVLQEETDGNGDNLGAELKVLLEKTKSMHETGKLLAQNGDEVYLADDEHTKDEAWLLQAVIKAQSTKSYMEMNARQEKKLIKCTKNRTRGIEGKQGAQLDKLERKYTAQTHRLLEDQLQEDILFVLQRMPEDVMMEPDAKAQMLHALLPDTGKDHDNLAGFDKAWERAQAILKSKKGKQSCKFFAKLASQ